MNKILVTGASGQVGNEIRELAPLLSSYSFVFAKHSDLDITSVKDIETLFSVQNFYAVINCAAYTAVDKAESEKEIAFNVNEKGAQNIAAATAKYNCRLVHISTDFIFDGTAHVPISETETPHPLSVYGLSKLRGEEAVLEQDKNAVVLRTSWVYSNYGNNFVKTILKLCKERDTLNIIADQTGTPTYARDLASAILHIVQLPEWKPGFYNYSNEGSATWYDFAIAIRDLAGLQTHIKPIDTSQYPTAATRPKYSVLNKKKVKETFGFQIPYWRHSLQTCIALLNS